MTAGNGAGFLLVMGMILYLLASVTPFPKLLRKDRIGGLLTPALASAGLVAHMAAILVQGVAEERCPVTNRYDILSLLSWLIVLIYVVAYLRSGMQILSVILTPLALVILVTSNVLEVFFPGAGPPGVEAEVKGPLFFLHVTIAILGVAALFLTFAFSLTYLLQIWILKRKQYGGWLRVLPPLDRCDRLVYRSLSWGFPLLTLGIVSGSLLESRHSGHFWSWRVDEAFSVIAWTIFAVLITARVARGWRGRKFAYLTIVGFVAGFLAMMGMYF